MRSTESEAEQTAQTSREDGSAKRDRPAVTVVAGMQIGETFALDGESVVLGRDAAADVQLMDEAVSRRHAQLEREGTQFFVRDLGSRNGTRVNGERVERRLLCDGDKIQLGATTTLRFALHDAIDQKFQEHMYESALRDGLTKAYNRRYLFERLANEFQFALRHKTPLSLVMLDVDHFKFINDSLGHVGGDAVLTALAERLQDGIRDEDVLARFGGEEFAVICRAVPPDKALAMAERLRIQIAARDFVYEKRTLRATISLGVSGLPNLPAADPMALVTAADRALYTAKRDGRNRVVLAVQSAATVDGAEAVANPTTKRHVAIAESALREIEARERAQAESKDRER